jgi:NADH-quinone oxidoreductase subunit E
VDFDPAKVDEILERYKGEQGLLISILQDIQAEFNYLPKEALLRASEVLDVPVSQVFGVVTFFKAFSLTPRGRHLVNVCMGTACHVRGAGGILGKIERELGVPEGGTTDDQRFTVDTVRCVGCCSLGPVVMINEDTHGRLIQEDMPKILDNYQ